MQYSHELELLFVNFFLPDTPSFSSEQINKIESIANENIRENRKVSVQVFKTAEELNNVILKTEICLDNIVKWFLGACSRFT